MKTIYLLLVAVIVQSTLLAEWSVGPVRPISGDESSYKKTTNAEAVVAYNIGTIELYKNQRPNTAIPSFLKAIELDPHYIEALDNIGVCYRQLGQYEIAKNYYNKSIEIFPNGEFAHLNLAIIYQIQKRPSDAIKEYKFVQVLNPSNPESYYELANVYANVGDYPKSIVYALRAVAIYKKTNSDLLGDEEQFLSQLYSSIGDDTSAKIWATSASRDKTDINSEVGKLIKQ